MGLYLVHVHDAPRDVTVVVAHDITEYEIEADSLRAACEMVLGKPVRTSPPVSTMHLQAPGHRDYKAPDRSRFHAVAAFTANDRDSLERALARSDKELDARALIATTAARLWADGERSTMHDCTVLVETWDDRDADHVALLKAWVENEWVDEERTGRTWFTDLHEKLASVGVDGPVERAIAEGVYWDVAREVVAEAEAELAASPKGP